MSLEAHKADLRSKKKFEELSLFLLWLDLYNEAYVKEAMEIIGGK